MDKLELPKIFEDKWDNLLIFSYGADLPFFENAIWRLFKSQCPNKIILMDGKQYLKACESVVDMGLTRFLNQRYLVDGIFIPQAAHAKIILLTNQESGCLAVGSGNLGQNGYASGGEIFSHYHYDQMNKRHAGAFYGVVKFIEEMQVRGFISSFVKPYLNNLYEKSPWLLSLSVDAYNPVRHNLNTNFLQQISEAVADEIVEELWIMSPFYDRDTEALQELIKKFSPKTVYLLLQSECTSVDPDALLKTFSLFPGICEVRSIGPKNSKVKTYLHAKLYLIKTRTKAVCLQGSPNLSRAAMLLCPPYGNIEVANLLIGKPGSFDYLFEDIEISESCSSLESLSLHLNQVDDNNPIEQQVWYLSGSEWIADELVLKYQGPLPDLAGACLEIGNQLFNVVFKHNSIQSIKTTVSEEIHFALLSAMTIRIVWKEDSNHQSSNPISVCNIAALNKYMLEGEGSSRTISEVGRLDIEDEEIERMFLDLDAALIVDQQSIWQMAGKSISVETTSDEEKFIKYEDINYEILKHHPKYQQYLDNKSGSKNPYTQSSLQIILNSINDHFTRLAEHTRKGGFINPLHDLDDDQFETEEEREAEEATKQKYKWSNKAKVKVIIKNFINRYIHGIMSEKFREIAGLEVMINNCVIFSHILWRLLLKDWVEHSYIAERSIEICEFYWGNTNKVGYLSKLNQDETNRAICFLKEHRADAQIFAALYCCQKLGWQESWENLHNIRISMRDFLRSFLSKEMLPISKASIEEMWVYVESLYPGTLPKLIVNGLLELTQYQTKATFLRDVEKEFGYQEGSCALSQQVVYRSHLQKSGSVQCLTISDTNAIAQIETVLRIVGRWSKFQYLDYYRITNADSSRIFYFDVIHNDGIFFNLQTDEEVEISKLPLPPTDKWENVLQSLYALTEELELDIQIKVEVN
jgi:hypothetical protein